MRIYLYGLLLAVILSCNNKSELIETLHKYPDCSIFEITNSHSQNILNWSIIPTNLEMVPYNENHFLVKAYMIDSSKNILKCFVNLSTPEGIIDYVVYDLDDPKSKYSHMLQDSEIILAVPAECSNLYDLFYSKYIPGIGLNLLKEALEVSNRKALIAPEIAYILRDEGRLEEALKYFLISIKYDSTSVFLHSEVEHIYRRLDKDSMTKEN